MSAETPAEQKATAIVTRPPMDFIPKNVDEAYRMAEMFGKSNLLPDALKAKPYDVLVVLLAGAEFGISPMAALREVYVVRGKAGLSSLLKIGLVKNSPHCEYFKLVESTAKRCIYETKRRGEPGPATRLEYTIEQATLAGYYPGDPGSMWKKDPALMLRRRCGGQLADEVYSDVTRGAADVDEMRDEERTFSGTTSPFAPDPVQVKSSRPPAPPPQDAEISEEKPPATTPAPTEPAPVDAQAAEADVAVMVEIEAAWAAAKSKEDMLATVPMMNRLSEATKKAYRPRYAARLKEVAP